ncbi:MAG: hypothetical protein WCP62_15045, partial [Planctomycetota bacterium]
MSRIAFLLWMIAALSFVQFLHAQQIELPGKPLLHLDAQQLALQLGQSTPGEQPVNLWSDSENSLLRFVSGSASQAPVLHVGEGWSSVRFDGVDDALTLQTPLASLSTASIWLVVAPSQNPGDFRGFLSTNAP